MNVCLKCTSVHYLPFVRIYAAHMSVSVLTVQGRTAKETVQVATECAYRLYSTIHIIMYLYIISAEINECLEGIHNCSENARCEKVVGGYTCDCHAGFEGNGNICTGIYNMNEGIDLDSMLVKNHSKYTFLHRYQ